MTKLIPFVVLLNKTPFCFCYIDLRPGSPWVLNSVGYTGYPSLNLLLSMLRARMVPGEHFVLLHTERQTSYGAWRLASVVYGDASTYTSMRWKIPRVTDIQLSSVVSFSEATPSLTESM